jgi:hypothetical protein
LELHFGDMAASPAVRQRVHRIQELYIAAKNKIRDEIILAEVPAENINLTAAMTRSAATLGDYVTLDWQHRAEIQGLIARILAYAEDTSRTRPLNIIMQAEPGSGKSHFIRCLANNARLNDTVRPVTFNMSGMQGIEDLIQPLDAVRNLKVIDKTPVLFLDEFDTNPAHYALLLPLLWDGELHVGHRDLKTGKVVIILAGSGESIQKAMTGAKTMQKPEAQSNKLVDLLSRINGGEFSIPDLDEVSGDRDRRADKVCVTAALLRQRFGPKLTMVPWSLLRFVAVTRFRYGVRSITHLVELLPASSEDSTTVNVDRLPIGTVDRLKKSSLAYHVVSDDGPAAVVADWKQFSAHNARVRIAEDPEEEIPF